MDIKPERDKLNIKFQSEQLQTTQKSINKKTHCYHCGEPCENDVIKSEDKEFCCHGCKTVFEILDENNLCTYYDLDAQPGIQRKTLNTSKFDYLESQEITEKLLNFSSDSLNKVTLYIPVIHCSSCIYLLEHLNRINESVIASKINFTDKEVSVDYDPEKFNLKDLAVLLSELGYEPEINLGTLEKKKSENDNYFYLKLGVAGFCFGNIMLLSFPDYFGYEVEPQFQAYFTYISMILSLPVLLFSGSDYYYSAYKGIIRGYANIDIPIALGIVSLFLRSSYEVITQIGTGYFDSLSGLIFFLLIGKWFQSKTYRTLSFNRDYTSYFPLAITRINKEDSESVLVNDLIVGDKILVKNEEIIPADTILLSEESNIDYSFVTGESVPVQKRKNEKVFAGGRIKGVAAIFQVIKPVSQNYLTQLWNNEAFSKKKTNQTQRLIDKISKYFTIAIIVIALVSAFIWSFYDISQSFFVFTAVLIVACPCALALATPFTMGSVLNVLGRHKFYLKNTAIIEMLWHINHIVFDKTGTITTADSKKLEYHGEMLTVTEMCNIKSLVQNSTHPMSKLIADYFEDLDGSKNLSRFQEHVGKGLQAWFGPDLYKLGAESFVNSASKSVINGSKSLISINGNVKGTFIMQSDYRGNIMKLIRRLKSFFSLSMLSGDNEKEKDKLIQFFPEVSNLHFHQKPEDKLNYIKELQHSDNKVMMIGDGLNDAGALKISDFGIAVTDDVSAFTPASDAIMSGNKLQYLDLFIRFVRQAKKVLLAAFILSFMYNLVGLGLAVTGNLTPILAAILMPISSISVVVFSTFAVEVLAKQNFTKH